MITYFKIAWRNLWRNKRRTLITTASIFFGVFFAVFMSSVQQGTMQNMVDNMVSFYTGYLQIQEEQFNENKSINNSFIPNEYLINSINSHNTITQSAQRLESFALAASELIALGMRKTRLTIMIIIESAYIGILRILSGVVVSLPLVWHLFINPLRVGGKIGETYAKMGFEPIIAFSMQPEVFYSPALTIFIMFAIISIYEIWYIAKLKTVVAIRA